MKYKCMYEVRAYHHERATKYYQEHKLGRREQDWVTACMAVSFCVFTGSISRENIEERLARHLKSLSGRRQAQTHQFIIIERLYELEP